MSVDAARHIGVVELCRPPNNYLDVSLLDSIVAALRAFDADDEVHVVVLRARGKHFCAGRDFSKPRAPGDESAVVYAHAAGLLNTRKPWVAAVQGAAVGAGLGLAAAADYRVTSPRAYFWANFVSHGLHPGFGLTFTLPRIVGAQRAALMLTGADRVAAETALRWGLADAECGEENWEQDTADFAARLAGHSPTAVQSLRQTMRGEEFVAGFRAAAGHESAEQSRLRPLPLAPAPDTDQPVCEMWSAICTNERT
jgi:enoyl-CoA hydratase/carnithine racemase